MKYLDIFLKIQSASGCAITFPRARCWGELRLKHDCCYWNDVYFYDLITLFIFRKVQYSYHSKLTTIL